MTAPNPEPARATPEEIAELERILATRKPQPVSTSESPAAASATTADDSGCSIRRVAMLDPTQQHDCDEVHRHYADGITDAIAECEARSAARDAELAKLREELQRANADGPVGTVSAADECWCSIHGVYRCEHHGGAS